MDKCNKCQQEITDNNNSYTCKKGSNSIKVCATCFKSNETSYMKGYDKVVKGSQAIKVPKPKIEGEESNFFECSKCYACYDYEKLSNSEIEQGCPNCQSKDFELKISLWNGILNYKCKECPKCHKMDMVDLIKWPDSDNTKGKSKQEIIKIIKQQNLNNSDNCQCSLSQKDNPNDREDNNDDHGERERERERESNSGFNWKSPWVIGGGIALVIVIGLVIYFLTKKNKPSEEY